MFAVCLVSCVCSCVSYICFWLEGVCDSFKNSMVESCICVMQCVGVVGDKCMGGRCCVQFIHIGDIEVLKEVWRGVCIHIGDIEVLKEVCGGVCQGADTGGDSAGLHFFLNWPRLWRRSFASRSVRLLHLVLGVLGVFGGEGVGGAAGVAHISAMSGRVLVGESR